jgi:hypothetical protein
MPRELSDRALTEPGTTAPNAREYTTATPAEEQLKHATTERAQVGEPSSVVAQNDRLRGDQTVTAAAGRRPAHHDLVAPIPEQVRHGLQAG